MLTLMFDTINSIISNNATQTKAEAKEKDYKMFESSLKLEFDNLKRKTNENVKVLQKQITLQENVLKIENKITDKVKNINTLFQQNTVLEKLIYQKIQQIPAQKPPQKPQQKKPAFGAKNPAPPSRSTPTASKPPEKPWWDIFPKKTNDGKNLSQGGVVGGAPGINKVKDTKTSRKVSELYSDVISLPLQAAGSSAVTVLGQFVKSIGPLSAFLSPYLKTIIKPYALSLGVSENLFNRQLLSPINTAVLDLNRQQKDFAKTWGMFLGDELFIGKFIDEEAGVGPSPSGVGTDFWTLAAVAALEDGRAQGVADVAQSVYNRLADGSYGKSIYDILTSDGQYQVAFTDPTASSGPGTKVSDVWKSITDADSAATAIVYYYEKRGQSVTKERAKQQVESAAANIKNETLRKNAAEFVQGRTDFLANNPDGVQRPEGGNSFSWEYGKKGATGTPWSLNAAPAPSFSRGGFGKKSIMSPTPFVVSGSESGFDYVLRDSVGRSYPVTLHGTEIIEPQDDGFKVYPVKNRSYDITKDPLALQKRWREIAYDTGEKSTASYSSGGSAEFWKIVALASKEDSLHSQGQADVAQSLYNRAAIGSYPGGKSITSIIMAPGQYQPTFTNAGSWNAIRDRKSAIAAAGNAQKVDMAAKSITNPELQKASAKFVGGRTDFMGESQKPYMKSGDVTRGKNYNFHGWFYDAKLPKPAPVPKMVSSITTPTTSASKPQSKVIVNSSNSSFDQNIVQSVQRGVTFVTNMLFNPNTIRPELNMQRVR